MPETAQRIDRFEDLDDTKLSYWKYEGIWWLYLPSCGVGNLSNHTIVENADGTITVSPSIKVTGHDSGKPMIRHGHLTNGIWTEC